ncbi:MAG: hypothetical protein ACRDF4_06655 [Rhabdochlamydiaceae bacterium]
MSDIQNARLATLVTLAEKSSQKLGRTAFMKLCYFLQTLRSVPLGYRFTLYAYGPFDSGVLSDLATAEALGGLQSTIIYYPSGYGYQISASENSTLIKELGADFLEQHETNIDWVLQQFAHFGSADLELLSTIVYVNRKSAEICTSEQLADVVHEIKPHFTNQSIRERLTGLLDQGLLQGIS